MVASNINLLAIVGPTASGKTALAIAAAKELNGEIIAVDSRTIYKGLNIGTAKPTIQQQAEVVHWGLDIIEPDQPFSAADFKEYANKIIKDISSRGKLPIMVGGTGLYMDGVLYDFSFAEPNHKLRSGLSGKTIVELQDTITKLGLAMPHNNKNKLHLITAIERNGVGSERKALRSGAIVVGISPDRIELRKTITTRAKQMIQDGVLDEIEHAATKYGWAAPGLQGGIYKSMRSYFEDTESLDTCIKNYITSDMRLAKRQMTWLKRSTDITWFTNTKTAEAWILKTLRSTL